MACDKGTAGESDGQASQQQVDNALRPRNGNGPPTPSVDEYTRKNQVRGDNSDSINGCLIAPVLDQTRIKKDSAVRAHTENGKVQGNIVAAIPGNRLAAGRGHEKDKRHTNQQGDANMRE